MTLGYSTVHVDSQASHRLLVTAALRDRPVANTDRPPVNTAPAALPPEIPRLTRAAVDVTRPLVPQ